MSDTTIERTETKALPASVVLFGHIDTNYHDLLVGQEVTFSGVGIVNQTGLRTDYKGKTVTTANIDVRALTGLNEREFDDVVLTASSASAVAAVDAFVPKADELIRRSKGLAIKERIAWFLVGGGFSVWLLAITNHLN